MDMIFATKFFGALFAIMNPFLILPIFLAMTSKETVKQQRVIAVQTVLSCSILCIVVAFAGHNIIGFFGITVDHFRIAGGIVLFGIAFSMLNGREMSSHTGTNTEKNYLDTEGGVAFYPMSFPIIVGPGTITTLTIYAYQTKKMEQYVAYGASLLLIMAIMLIVLFFASAIGKMLSNKIRIIVTRIMGMMLVAVSVGMVTTGLSVLLPGLAG
ncbi:MarC family protein [Sneathiella aquimaris]|uniref:MarC family protein n=1 Tax=Sneathiella aquimaris TaxID=2599305 RepID=UPI00146AEFF0|nr:MarC family protein [Sneathiella aquimaris]